MRGIAVALCLFSTDTKRRARKTNQAHQNIPMIPILHFEQNSSLSFYTKYGSTWPGDQKRAGFREAIVVAMYYSHKHWWLYRVVYVVILADNRQTENSVQCTQNALW